MYLKINAVKTMYSNRVKSKQTENVNQNTVNILSIDETVYRELTVGNVKVILHYPQGAYTHPIYCSITLTG